MDTSKATGEGATPRRKVRASEESRATAEGQVEMTLTAEGTEGAGENMAEAIVEVNASAEAGSAEPAASAPDAVQEQAAEAAEGSQEASAENLARMDRKRLEEQLDALKRKESELRRALAIADHPVLADAIRELEGCAFSVTRVEAKMAQGLSKSEERRRETLDKKLVSLREKRAELDAQINEIEGELAELGELRTRAFEAERREAMERLITVLGTHQSALAGAGLEAASLVPELARWMPEIIALAEELSARRTA